MSHSLLFVNQTGKQRSTRYLPEDKAALQAILQACVDVELFTIPLYMTALYSIQGTHAINSKKNDFYKGRLWPGMGLTAQPKTANERAFNSVFSVFVAEMLHLQLASNMCNAAGYTPTFTSKDLVYQPGEKSDRDGQEHAYGWRCYGPDVTVLPNIVDFKDTIRPDIRVNVGPLNVTQTDLFLIIEETETDAKKLFGDKPLPECYDSVVPFKSWSADPETRTLPLFSSIGVMYTRLWEYLSLEYDELRPVGEGEVAPIVPEYMQLWDYVYADTQKAGSLFQKEVFNSNPADEFEYPSMTTQINQGSADEQLKEIMNMINGITDQGEGDGVIKQFKARLAAEHAAREGKDITPMLMAVQEHYQPSKPNLEKKYPSFDPGGEKLPESAQANARTNYGNPHMPANGAMDHFEIFSEIMQMLKITGGTPENTISTWADWHANPDNKWTKEMLEVAGVQNNYPDLPATEDIASALNNLKLNDAAGKNFELFSHTAAGSIAGVTTVLDKYFNNKYPKAEFPYPSMSGSGDRMGICWAIFGKAPELWLGMLPRTQPGVPAGQELFHACQGMSLIGQDDANTCASEPVFHSCKSSNMCKTEGGCGFVQNVAGGAGCGSPKGFRYSNVGGQGDPKLNLSQTLFTTPANNNCGGLGGCAVPISASQMYPAMIPKEGAQPTANLMITNSYTEEYPYDGTEIRRTGYPTAKLVYDTAWEAFALVMEQRGAKVEKPKPSDLRLAFPPST